MRGPPPGPAPCPRGERLDSQPGALPGTGLGLPGDGDGPGPVRHVELAAAGAAWWELPAGRGAVVAKAPASPPAPAFAQQLSSNQSLAPGGIAAAWCDRGRPRAHPRGARAPGPRPASPRGGPAGGLPRAGPCAPQAQGRAAAHRMYPITLRVNCALTPQVPHSYAMQPGGGATAPSPLRAPPSPFPGTLPGGLGRGGWPGPAACT